MKKTLYILIPLIIIIIVFGVTRDTSPDEKADWQTYQNKEYGFALTFPDTWEGYIVEVAKQNWDLGELGVIDVIVFGFPEQEILFLIHPFPLAQIEKFDLNKLNPIDYLGPVDYSGENNKFVFYGQSAHDTVNNEMDERVIEVRSILKSLRPIDF